MIKTIARTLTPRWLWRRLRTSKMRRMLDRFEPFVAEHVYAGVPLKVNIADPLGQGWYDHDWAPMPEIDLLRQGRLQAGARVFDIGAHQGVVAMILAHAVGPNGAVVAIEALPHNARVGAVNVQLNGVTNVHYEQAAISDRAGAIDVSLDLNSQVLSSGTTIGTLRVRAMTIDELSERFGCPDVLFIDVEGFECHALRGAARTLEQHPDCFIEVHAGCGLEAAGSSVQAVFEHFAGRDYDFMAWTDEAPRPRPVARAEECPAGRFLLVAIHRAGPMQHAETS